MNNGSIKTIALILENIFTDFAKEFIRNVTSVIKDRSDIRLVVISGKYDGNTDPNNNAHRYKTVYNSIYKLEELCEFDGLIICLGSMAFIDRHSVENRFFTALKDTPKVFAIADLDNQICVNYDNEPGIREAIDCLVNVHGITKICMLGGREDNIDSVKRKEIFEKCLKDNNIDYNDSLYESTDMSTDINIEASRLLDRNPDCQAIFCVNDAVAFGLYKVLSKRNLIPGQDILVFGFDNTTSASRTLPTLASIGASDVTIGQKSMELLLKMIDGIEVSSVNVPTALYGRQSFEYERYEYTTLEMLNVDKDFIDRMFDDCFYRYKYVYHSREDVDIRKLFRTFMTKILGGLRDRHISIEEFEETLELVDIFFENNAIEYTDAVKLIKSIDRLQGSINAVQGLNANIFINRIFTHMKDCAVYRLSESLIRERTKNVKEIKMFQYFMVETTDYGFGRDMLDSMIRNFDKLGLRNSALYTFAEHVRFGQTGPDAIPEYIDLRCILKGTDLYIIPPERRKGPLKHLFNRSELPSACNKCVAFPVFYKDMIYGCIVCELTRGNVDSGEYIADQIGRTIHTNDISMSGEGDD